MFVAGGLPYTVDSQVKLKISRGRRSVLTLSAGEHELTAKLGPSVSTVIVTVKPGEPTYVVYDYQRKSMMQMMVSRDPAQNLTVTLEHTNAPPDGKFEDEKLGDKEVASLAALQPMHEVQPAATSVAELEPLTEMEIREALLQGEHIGVPGTIGLLLDDQQRRFGSALSQGQSVSGFSVRVYTAKQWLELLAANAKYEMRPFTVADLTPEMKQKRLYVIAHPSTPDLLNGKNMAVASNVQRIVLEEGASRAVVQPLDQETTAVRLNSALRSADFQGMSASFPQPDVTKPFHIVVIGDADKKEFEVKDKHLSRLR